MPLDERNWSINNLEKDVLLDALTCARHRFKKQSKYHNPEKYAVISHLWSKVIDWNRHSEMGHCDGKESWLEDDPRRKQNQ